MRKSAILEVAELKMFEENAGKVVFFFLHVGRRQKRRLWRRKAQNRAYWEEERRMILPASEHLTAMESSSHASCLEIPNPQLASPVCDVSGFQGPSTRRISDAVIVLSNE